MDELRKEMLKVLGYSDKAISVLESEIHYGEMEHPSVSVRHQAGCGDVLMLDLRIEDDIIREAAFRFVGCSGMQASASGVSEMVIGMSLDAADKINTDDILRFLEGLPENKHECAEASSKTLREAIAAYRVKGR